MSERPRERDRETERDRDRETERDRGREFMYSDVTRTGYIHNVARVEAIGTVRTKNMPD